MVLSSYADAPRKTKAGEARARPGSPLGFEASWQRAEGFSCSSLGRFLPEVVNSYSALYWEIWHVAGWADSTAPAGVIHGGKFGADACILLGYPGKG